MIRTTLRNNGSSWTTWVVDGRTKLASAGRQPYASFKDPGNMINHIQMPTVFHLKTFTGPEYERKTGLSLTHASATGAGSSQMLLRVRARPDFYSHIESAMLNAPVVDFELVLDPLLFRAIPRSLLGTIILILFTSLIGFKIVGPRALSVIEEQVKERRYKVVRIKTQ